MYVMIISHNNSNCTNYNLIKFCTCISPRTNIKKRNKKHSLEMYNWISVLEGGVTAEAIN